MDWSISLAVIVVLLIGFLLSGLPVAFAFFLIGFVGVIGWMGGIEQIHLISHTLFPSIAHYSYVAIPLFILMGAILFHSGVATLAINALGVFAGGVRGSLSHLAVASGTAFSLLSGSAISSVALLGSTLIPEMRRRGYSNEMSIGPILGAGGLAVIIPPSIFAIILAYLARISVGHLLIASIIPGLLLAIMYVAYISIRVRMRPDLAPQFDTTPASGREKLKAAGILLSVVGLIVVVLGLIFFGVATPTEAAGAGAAGAFVLAFAYRALTWEGFRKAVSSTLGISCMVLMIVAASASLSRLLSFTGITRNLSELAISAPLDPMMIVFLMILVVIFLGMLMDAISIMMITVPLFFPIVIALGVDPMWFAVVMLIALELSTVTPPFGILLFTMNSVVPDASYPVIVKAAVPFVVIDFALICLLFLVPGLVTWLPAVM